ncbi:MAG TPA: M28 family peptidase, partial [Longimicrobium sp.]|nr:M28 family peptidase [Longimicrobium sp.]
MFPSFRTPRSARLALLCALAALAACGGGGDLGRPADRPEVSADRAWVFLTTQLGFGPRDPGRPDPRRGHDPALAWLREQLAIRADTVLVDTFTHRAADGKTLRLANLFARWHPERTDRILLVAHWDTRPRADRSADSADRRRPVPGANDGASGVAVLMEVAELMRQQAPPVGVDILLTDGEDYGPGREDLFLGSRRFAAHLPPGYRPRWTVVLDMVGDADARFPRASGGGEGALAERVWGIAAQMGYDSVFAAPGTAAGG